MQRSRPGGVRCVGLVLWVGALLLAMGLWPSKAQAYGPMTHMLEGGRFLALASEEPELSAEVKLIESGEPRLYFDFGTMYPDLREVASFPFGTHDVTLAEALLAAATDGPAWQRAFARGYAQHIHSDSAAQVFLVPWITVDNRLGEVDLLDDLYTDHPGGETELYVEGGIDLYHGDVGRLWRVLEFFVLDRRGVGRFMELFDFYYGVACEVHPSACASQDAIGAELESLVQLVYHLRFVIHEPMLQAIVSHVSTLSLGEILARWLPLAGLGWDSAEMARLGDEPLFASADYLSVYLHDFARLGPEMALSWSLGRDVFRWPVWHRPTLLHSAQISLAALMPGRYEVSGRLSIYEARFEGPGGEGLSSLSASSLPGSLSVMAKILPLRPFTGTVGLRVMAEFAPGEPHRLCSPNAWATGELEVQSGELSTVWPLEITVDFDPSECAAEAAALYIEVVEGSELAGPAMFTGSWEALADVPGRELGQEVYRQMYEPASQRSAYVIVNP